MQTLVIFDSKFGNTQRVAEAIARGASGTSDVRLLNAADVLRAIAAPADPPDLLLIGGPTHNRGASAGLKSIATALPATLRGVPTACFDTRYRGPAFVMGSAAGATARDLERQGADLVAPPESFFIARRGPMPAQTLEPGELERAAQWGAAIAAMVAA